MDYKQIVTAALSDALACQSTRDEIASKLERPKTSDKGDMAFPTFTLAKLLHQTPQQIAQDLAEKLNCANHVELSRTLTGGPKAHVLQLK